MDVLKLLEDVKNDKVSLEEAAKELKQLPYEDLGFAKLDHHRQIRSGFGEVVFCSGKSDEHLLKIYETFYKTDTEVLGTRASEHQYELVKAVIPEVTYDPLSRILKIEKPGKEKIGRVAVCTAGTADIAVAEEAAQVAEYFGTNVDRFYDVGVAGIHRLFAKLEEIRKREERKDRLHQNYLKRKASGAQKRYEDKIKAKKKAEMDAKKEAIRAEDVAKGVFVPVCNMPKLEPKIAPQKGA